MMGDIKWFDYCEPFVIDLENKKVCFGYFPMPDPE